MSDEQMDFEQRKRRLHAGLFSTMRIDIVGEDAIRNDGLALGAALQDLQREGWRLAELVHIDPERENGLALPILRAVLTRSWHVRHPLSSGGGALIASGLDEAAPDP